MEDDEMLYREMNEEDPFYMGEKAPLNPPRRGKVEKRSTASTRLVGMRVNMSAGVFRMKRLATGNGRDVMSTKILYLHGMASSHACPIAAAIQRYLPEVELIVPDLSVDPEVAFSQIDAILRTEPIVMIIGHSLGGFMAQKYLGYPKVLINPSLGIFYLRLFNRENRYRMERYDGVQHWRVTKQMYQQYVNMEMHQFDDLSSTERSLTVGCFGCRDLYTKYSAQVFSAHYTNHVMMPGGHYPTDEVVREYIVPKIKERLA